jgi:hypothetical protein
MPSRSDDCRDALPGDVAHLLLGSYPGRRALAPLRVARHLPLALRGAGVRIGLIEAALAPAVIDLHGVTVRCFARTVGGAKALREHGTHSASLLAAQGRRALCGLVPAATLHVAIVAEADGRAEPQQVVAALDWLVAEGCDLVAIPLGDSANDAGLSDALWRAHARAVRIFAAAGNAQPLEVMFPARHPAVLSVGACDARGRLRPECCRRPHLDCVMPGTDIPGLIDRRTVAARSGSSVACVIAVGLAALELAAIRARPHGRPEHPRLDARPAPNCSISDE